MDLAYAIRQERTTGLKPVFHQRSLQLQVVEDAAGLQVNWNPHAVDSVPRDPGASAQETMAATPLAEIQKDLDSVTLDGLLNQADTLSKLLESARFKAESRESYGGSQVRVLTFSCKPEILAQHQGRVTQAESTLKVWIGDDGAPLATESLVDYNGKHSRLYGRIHSNSLVKTTYTVLGDRLVVTSRTSEDSLYDYGDRLKNKKTLTLAVHG
jgi:hypothetical protein